MKGFDTVELSEIITALEQSRIDSRYINLMKHTTTDKVTGNVKLYRLMENSQINIRVRTTSQKGAVRLNKHQKNLKMNMQKETIFMTNLVLSENLLIDGTVVEQVSKYKFLGHEIHFGRVN